MTEKIELSELTKQTNNFTSAYDARHRTFERLRRLDLDDEKRTAALDEYRTAAAEFGKLRDAVLKPKEHK